MTIRSIPWDFTKDMMHVEATLQLEIFELHLMSDFLAICSNLSNFSSIILFRFFMSFLSDFVSKNPKVAFFSMQASMVILEENFFAS